MSVCVCVCVRVPEATIDSVHSFGLNPNGLMCRHAIAKRINVSGEKHLYKMNIDGFVRIFQPLPN